MRTAEAFMTAARTFLVALAARIMTPDAVRAANIKSPMSDKRSATGEGVLRARPEGGQEKYQESHESSVSLASGAVLRGLGFRPQVAEA
jgi:hypothetical protein